jgi:serine/threonine protein kinase
MNILSELCEQGTLFDLLQKYQGKLSEDQIIFILKDVARGL